MNAGELMADCVFLRNAWEDSRENLVSLQFNALRAQRNNGEKVDI